MKVVVRVTSTRHVLTARIAHRRTTNEASRTWRVAEWAQHRDDVTRDTYRFSESFTTRLDLEVIAAMACKDRKELLTALAAAEREVDALKSHSVYLYNVGYGAGHNDTVEGCYTDVFPVDAHTYHDDIVGGLLDELLKEHKKNC